jgi:hypothetical protein
LKALKAEQKCAKLEANLEKSEIAVKLKDAEQKAQMAAKAEANFFCTLSRNYNNILTNWHFKLTKRQDEIEALRIQIGQMAKEARAQKELEQEHLQTIFQLRAVDAQQTKEVSAK